MVKLLDNEEECALLFKDLVPGVHELERQQLEDINGYYGHQNLGADLSSYVAVVGAPTRLS